MSKEDAIKALIAHRTRFRDDFGWDKMTLEALDIAITSLTTESKPVVRGEWKCESEAYPDYGLWNKWQCSECGYVRTKGWEHTSEGKKPNACICENCGADMKKEANDER